MAIHILGDLTPSNQILNNRFYNNHDFSLPYLNEIKTSTVRIETLHVYT